MDILIKNILHNNEIVDVYIEKNIIKKIDKNINISANKIINGTNKAILPSFINAHTHSGMTLMRGYADDMRVIDWLQHKIWPLEKHLTHNDVYWGTKLACLEMIKSGTTCFYDMYWEFDAIVDATLEMGMRAILSPAFADFNNKQKAAEQQKKAEKRFEKTKKLNEKINFSLSAHAIYTVSENSLKWIKEFSESNDLLLHIHISESKQEIEDCLKLHNCRPVEYINRLGLVSPRLMAAHAIWLNDNEFDILSRNQANVITNPASNMKLASGCMNYPKMQNKINVLIGTDGVCSNNNLDILEEMKLAALQQKMYHNDPEIMPAQEVYNMATVNAAKAFNLKTGEIKEGFLADCILINLKHHSMVPNHNLISNLVYSSNEAVVDTTICNGEILMENRYVKDEEEIIEKAEKQAFDFVNR